MKKYSLIYHINAPGGGVGLNKYGIQTSVVKGYKPIGANHVKDYDRGGSGMGHACIMACVNNIPIFNLRVTMKTYPGLYKELSSQKHYDCYQKIFAKEGTQDQKPTVKLWSYMKSKYPDMINFETKPGANKWHTQSGANSIQIIRNEALFDHRWVGKRYSKKNNSKDVIRVWNEKYTFEPKKIILKLPN